MTTTQFNCLSPEQEKSKQYWKVNTTKYDRVKKTFSYIIGGSQLPVIIPGPILEIGCSKGETSRELTDLYPFCHVVSIEINSDLIKQAQERNKDNPHLDFFNADGYQRLFAPETFGAVVAMNNIAQAYKESDHNPEFKTHINNIASQVMQEGFLLLSQNQPSIILQRKGNKFSVFFKGYIKNKELEGLVRLLNEN